MILGNTMHVGGCNFVALSTIVYDDPNRLHIQEIMSFQIARLNNEAEVKVPHATYNHTKTKSMNNIKVFVLLVSSK